ncbi:maleylpyruvate isomerase family mycothiol-dependent enzyme [Kribbella sandramycini]|uniref:Maleylpyruvate isomerase family mycothiol-dependent enzyme n=1 Tax=Kribbella sandramycini TaxID=60450 RepID=A0A7Y4L2T8_9ACTN|nr:maleylpyruvate isomerase N-terminal domain-containing protein [Kribbella sandramycini]MBB6564669.1 uncharacterized protein (TIGR03083 family) [Kribbella sandramycini]NOL42371.1 maleylpyruvate isomerase family mycothiol-dependent enzyme [Kribbella sandramycini]
MLDHLTEFEKAAALLAVAFDEIDPAAPVPACPGWAIADLALHIGAGQRWAASIVLSGVEQRRPEGVLRAAISWGDWYAGTTAALAAALRAVDPAEPCWNFAPVEQRAGFWSRRRLHETVIHLVDAGQAAAAAPGSVPTGLAAVPAAVFADGVAEVFEVFLPRMLARGAAPAVTEEIGVRATDTGHEWTLTPSGQGLPPQIRSGVATGAAVLEGSAVVLDLCLWKRLPAAALTVRGEARAAAAFLGAEATP